MLILAIIGWLLIAGLGGYALVAAYVAGRFNLGFTGGLGTLPVVLAVVGVAAIGFAIWIAPFSIVFGPRQ